MQENQISCFFSMFLDDFFPEPMSLIVERRRCEGVLPGYTYLRP